MSEQRCDDAKCSDCYPKAHWCSQPHNGEFNVGDSWICPDCGMEWDAVNRERWMKVTGLNARHADRMVEPIWISGMGLTA